MNHGLKRRIGVADDPTAQRPSLRDCLEAVLQEAGPLIDGVFDGLSGASPRTQGIAVQGAQNAVAKLATAYLAGHRPALRESFVSHLRELMYGGVHGGGTQPLLSFEGLLSFEDKQLDESIEVARAQQEVAHVVDDSLPALDALMSTMLGWITVQSQLNPLRPEVFVRALRECVAQYVDDADARNALITPAAGRLGISLRKLYREVADWLRSHGIEPAGAAATSAVPETISRTANPGNSVARTLLTLDRLRKLLSGELDGAPGNPGRSGPPRDFLHTVPASLEALQDMKQVEAMMQRLERKARQPSATGVPAPPRRRALDGRQLGKELGEEVVHLMLENLIQDERVLPPVRRQLETLEPMLLKLSQADARFFNERQHPARQLLDRIIHRSLAFTSERDDGFPRFLKTVEDATGILRQHPDEGAAPFARILQKLEETWARQDKVQRQRREEAARALLHAEQRNLLAQRLSQEFRARLEGKQTPAFVTELICGAWAQAVAESQLSTDGTSDPHGYQALVDDLAWSVQPQAALRNRARLVELIPTLLVKLRHGLQLIDYPAERIGLFFDELISLHEAALEDARPKAAPAREPDRRAEADEALSREVAEASAFWVGEQEASESGYLDAEEVMPLDLSTQPGAPQEEKAPLPLAIGELPTGAWVELMLEGAWVRAQLSWASPHRTLFMFISRGGLAHSMSRRTMERLRRQGLIRVVSEGHAVDQAFDAVAQAALRNTLGGND